MRRAALAVTLTAVTVASGACASLPFGSDEGRTVPPAATPTGPVATSQQFDQPFPVAGDSWDATVTLSNLRIVPSSAYEGTVLAVDVRAVQSAGQPELGPDDISAYSPSGTKFDRIQSPAGLVADPLVPTVMTSPGDPGMVAWTIPPEIASAASTCSPHAGRSPSAPACRPVSSTHRVGVRAVLSHSGGPNPPDRPTGHPAAGTRSAPA